MQQKVFKTALVLSGGSARALTHLGVLEEIERHGLPVDIVVGTSMGAIIGALYALYGSTAPILERLRRLVGSDLFLKAVSVAGSDSLQVAADNTLNRFIWLFKSGIYCTQSVMQSTMVSESDYLKIMSDLIPDVSMDELKIPFAAVAMDLISGEEIVLAGGSLLAAVSASAAIPGILPSVTLHGRRLVDGGWVDNVPVAPAFALGAHFVLAVDASLSMDELGPPPTAALESLLRSNEISRILLNRYRKASADIMLTPRIGKMHWANFAALEPCTTAGRKAFEENLSLITESMHRHRDDFAKGIFHPHPGDPLHPFTILS